MRTGRAQTERFEKDPADAGRFELGRYPMYLMAHILQRYDAAMGAELRRHGLKHASWRVLASLQYRDGMTIGQIAAYSTLERSFIGRVVHELDGRGLVIRAGSDADRRSVRVTLTAAGREIFSALLRPTVEGLLRDVYDGVSPAEQSALIDVLSRMMGNAYRMARADLPEL